MTENVDKHARMEALWSAVGLQLAGDGGINAFFRHPESGNTIQIADLFSMSDDQFDQMVATAKTKLEQSRESVGLTLKDAAAIVPENPEDPGLFELGARQEWAMVEYALGSVRLLRVMNPMRDRSAPGDGGHAL